MKTYWRYPAVVALLTCAVLVLYACTGNESTVRVSSNSVWSEYVSAHSGGTISKAQAIKIRFVNDVVGADKTGTSAEPWVEITPSVKAGITFANPREIVITPADWLESGSSYVVRVKTKGLLGIPEKLEAYSFEVTAMPQNFEIETDVMKTDSESREYMVLSGRLTTADITRSGNLQQVLHASYEGKDVDISWQHNSDGLNHRFTLKKVKRKSSADSIELKWDGKAIGASNEGKSEISVPALGEFIVQYAKLIYGQKQYIEVGFSDNLNTSQHLDDYVLLADNKFTTRIEGNVLKIYPQQSIKGDVLLQITEAVRNTQGDTLSKPYSEQLKFVSQKPQVRFVGKGVIIPENKFLTIPFEVMNVHSVQVTAFRIYENNIGQFLQNNKLDGSDYLERVGRYMWRKTIKLTSPEAEHWNRYTLDATDLLKKDPGGMYRLTLSINRGNAIYTCSESENQAPVQKEEPFTNYNSLNASESSGWDFADENYNDANSQEWADRNNPCKDAYYQQSAEARQSRNFLASNIGLLAKRDNTGVINIVTTDIRSGSPMAAVDVNIFNFQNQVIKTTTTDSQGFATIKDSDVPFYLVAKKLDDKKRIQVGYLKMSPGSALAVSHFDVGGHKIQNGVKGYIYGERGVWRPGDNIYLVLALEDKNKVLPTQHPVTMNLINPQGQLVQTLTNNTPVDNLYRFDFHTDENAPTGNWQVRALLGGRQFNKELKIETVVPNRLKLELDLGGEVIYSDGKPQQGKLFAQWLHGAKASGLKADVEVSLAPSKTEFGSFTDFEFDDPTRAVYFETMPVVEGNLDDEGYLTFSKTFKAGDGAPGLLRANFTSRVFENSGAFSISQSKFEFHPYQNYVGIKLPKGDQTRGMLLTDTDHVVQIASLDAHGNKSSLDEVEVSLYKIHWKWWWDQTSDSLAQYANADVYSSLQHDIVKTVNGHGQWTFKVKYPDWGRYMVRACDKKGNHCSAKVVYIDWPGWAGRAQEQSGPGASVLNVSSDKTEYQVGDTAILSLPKTSAGRALLSLESGTRIIKQEWVVLSAERTQIPLKITADMAPNIYANITLIQAHEHKNNDLPIRLYGIVPIKVSDPKTHLHPVITSAEEWAPKSKVKVSVSEQQGKPMSYTLAVVDEGLLGLTNFKTPDLHQQFYKKEALGVETWDLFDDVLNAYGGKLERMLALGGGAEGQDQESKKPRRFPPVVKFFGPFKLDNGQTKAHEFELPSYMGALRVMVVAAHDAAYGSDSKSVFVRQPLVVLPTLPRVVGSGETFTVPVSIFVSEAEIKSASLSINVDDYFEVVGENSATLKFQTTGDKIAFLTLRAKSKLGQGKVDIGAKSGKFQAQTTTYLTVRAPNPATTRQISHELNAGERWETDIAPHGLENSNSVKLEASSLPPLNLNGRLQFLVQYPYGCLEQVTSSVFPQLYLPKLLQLNDSQHKEIDNNIHAAIDRLRQFQASNGSFQYWPGESRFSDWANNYAGQFLVEASRQGYDVPADMLSRWTNFQSQRARSLVTGDQYILQSQAYRLYTLALANQAEMGAMNRLRENNLLDNLGRWYLGAAYLLAGQTVAAQEIINALPLEFKHADGEDPNFGSAIRDQAVALNTLILLGRQDQAMRVAGDISKHLASDKWFSTQSLAFALSAVARYMGVDPQAQQLSLQATLGNQKPSTWKWNTPILQQSLAVAQHGKTALLLENTNQRKLFLTITSTGVPAAGEETEFAKGLSLKVEYKDSNGESMDINSISQGKDFTALVTVTNASGHRLQNLALTHILASGWEIHNDRFSNPDQDAQTAKASTNSERDTALFQYRDIRDDRVYTFFELASDEQKQFVLKLNAAYAGHYYLPGVSVEDMYNVETNARVKGQWIDVNKE